MTDNNNHFWGSAPGILTAVAGIITALAGLFAVLKPANTGAFETSGSGKATTAQTFASVQQGNPKATTEPVTPQTPEPPPVASPPSKMVSVSSSKWLFAFDPPVNVRSTPDGNIIFSLAEKQHVEVIGEEGPWYKVRINNRVGYIHGSQLRQ